ncbi:MAG: hypothetical protein REI11_19705, partial [Patulibacter sp.]|nr:hypothetical protein [Patulibacter sp.]
MAAPFHVTPPPSNRRRFLRDVGAAGAMVSRLGPAALPAFLAQDAAAATAGIVCPNPHPIVHENRCTDPATFTDAFQITDDSTLVDGFARQPSVNVGESVELVISGPNRYLPPAGQSPIETVEIDVYRLGYYDGKGGRRVWGTSGPVSTFQKVDGAGNPSNEGARPADFPVDAKTGLRGSARDRTIATVPGWALGTSGVYLAKLRGKWLEFPPNANPIQGSGQALVVFVVRDDERPRDLLVLLPSNTWQAYNYARAPSLYTDSSHNSNYGVIVPATGTERAAKVSLDRPYNNTNGQNNWVLRTEFPAIWWLERHGYDVAYTEDVAFHFAPEQAAPEHSRGVAILGHGEYWTAQQRSALEAARDAGTNLYNFGANTGYWRVRYETTAGRPASSVADARVLVCFKTIEGGGTANGQVASQADPVEPTTTFRDPGKGKGVAQPGTTGATPSTYTGNARPERELLGVQYTGDDDSSLRGLTVPAGNGAGEFAAHPAWRHTNLPSSGIRIGTGIVGWEWDGIPTASQPFSGNAPATLPGTGGVKRLSQTDPRANAPQ